MRSGAAHGYTGFLHETALYDSDDSFLSTVVPFVTGGVEAGEPTVVAFTEANERLLRSALGDLAGITFISGSDRYSRPASAIKAHREMLARYVAAGAAQVRIVGDVPHPGTGVPWEWWSRYEIAVNQAYDQFPAYGLCPYDTRTTPADVLEDVARTHAFIATPDGEHTPNPRYGEPPGTSAGKIDELELSPPLTELVNPSLTETRHVALAACAGSSLTTTQIEDFVFACSEAVTNALCHGQLPVRMRLWADRSHAVVAVTDQGKGPADAMAGLMPVSNTPTAGLGLFITHLTSDYVAMSRDDDGFTIRVVAGTPRFLL